ncbi:MAG: phosphoadenosine phosphosulfate reductase family protein, partial [Chloroflexota bacterium]
MRSKKVRHILSLSGGKDSTALAIYLRDRIPDLEYVFCDTEKELPETYEYLELVEAYLGRRIVRLKHDGRDFDHHLTIRHGYIPSSRNRWCTEYLKLKPFERYVGNDQVISYIGIRCDEDRSGYISSKPNIRPVYPFKDAGIDKRGVMKILEESGLGLPRYYKWRSRSGCYFCFFQQKIEWVGLLENHPDLFAKAREYETKQHFESYWPEGQRRHTWDEGESLDELARPERVAQIKAEHERRMMLEKARKHNLTLVEVFGEVLDDEPFGDRAC